MKFAYTVVFLIFSCSALQLAAGYIVGRAEEFEGREGNHSVAKRATAARTCNAELYEGSVPGMCTLPSSQRTLPNEARTCQSTLKARSLSTAEAVCLWDCAYQLKKWVSKSGTLDSRTITADFTRGLDSTWTPIATDAVRTCLADATKAAAARITTGYATNCKMAAYMFNTCFRVRMLDRCPKSAQTSSFSSGRRSLASCDFAAIVKPVAAKVHSGTVVKAASNAKLTKVCNAELYEVSSTGALDSKTITADFSRGLDKTWLPIATDAIKTCLTDATKASTAKLASGYVTRCKPAAYMFNTCFRVKLLDKCPRSAQSSSFAVARSALGACDFAAMTRSTAQMAKSGLAALQKANPADLKKGLELAQKDPNALKSALGAVPPDMLKSLSASSLKSDDLKKLAADPSALAKLLGK